MQKAPLKHLIYWGIGGAAAGEISMLLFYDSAPGVGGSFSLAVLTTPLVVLWGVAAGAFTHYTWYTGARFVACLLGVVAGFLSLLELIVTAFTGPTRLSGVLFALFDLRYPSFWQLIGGTMVAGLLYQTALLVVLLVLRQLFRWTNTLVGVLNAKGQGKSE